MCRHAVFVAMFFGCLLFAQTGPGAVGHPFENQYGGVDLSKMFGGAGLVNGGGGGGAGGGGGGGAGGGAGGGGGGRQMPGSRSGSPPRMGRQLSLGRDNSPGYGGQARGPQTPQNQGRMGGTRGQPPQLSRSRTVGSGGGWNQQNRWGQPGGQTPAAGGRGGALNQQNGSGRGAGQKGSGSDFEQVCLNAHNELRAKHGVPPLTLSRQLCQSAQAYANQLARTDPEQDMQHSRYGENLSATRGYAVTGRSAVDDWYAEIDNYDWNTEGSKNGQEFGHFTELIWKGVKQMGVGHAKSAKGNTYVVCHYDPIGNVQGEFKENVPRLLR